MITRCKYCDYITSCDLDSLSVMMQEHKEMHDKGLDNFALVADNECCVNCVRLRPVRMKEYLDKVYLMVKNKTLSMDKKEFEKYVYMITKDNNYINRII